MNAQEERSGRERRVGPGERREPQTWADGFVAVQTHGKRRIGYVERRRTHRRVTKGVRAARTLSAYPLRVGAYVDGAPGESGWEIVSDTVGRCCIVTGTLAVAEKIASDLNRAHRWGEG